MNLAYFGRKFRADPRDQCGVGLIRKGPGRSTFIKNVNITLDASGVSGLLGDFADGIQDTHRRME